MSEQRVKAVWHIADGVTERRFDSEEYSQIMKELSAVVDEVDGDEEAKRLCSSFLEKSKLTLRKWLQEGYLAYSQYDNARKQKVLCAYLKRILRGELLGRQSGTWHPRVDDARALLNSDETAWELVYQRLQEKAG